MRAPILETARLVLRPWRDEDRAPFARMNADPRVMKHFPTVLTAEQSDIVVERIRDHFDAHGFGLWAVEIRNETAFAGFVGLAIPRFEAPFMPCIEIGWRLAHEHQGRGYATEGAREALRFGFEELAREEILSFTVTANTASRRVMSKLGMTHDAAGDFDHPALAEGHPLRRHVLYRLSREAWKRMR